MVFLAKAVFRWNESSKNADISILSNFLAFFSDFFSPYREILPSTIYMPNFRSIGPSKQKVQLQGGGGGRFAKSPACLGLMHYYLNFYLSCQMRNMTLASVSRLFTIKSDVNLPFDKF